MEPRLSKHYDQQELEHRILALWADHERAGLPPRDPNAPKFSMVLPPPNVTGTLHLGHALNATLQDISCRFMRMQGYDVKWIPGTDHAGIATQTIVERHLAAVQLTKEQLGRPGFIERVWDWKEQSGGQIIEQLKRLGASCDWKSLAFTMGDRYAEDHPMLHAVRTAFLSLFNSGYLYLDHRLVNWDPILGTAISDLEVQQSTEPGELFTIQYPLCTAEGEPTGETIAIATSRPETILGDTGIAVHPDDSRYKNLVNRFALVPLLHRIVPIVADRFVDPEKGTGAVKVTPAHDFNDFQCGKTHGLRMIALFDTKGAFRIEGNHALYEGCIIPPEILQLHGQDRLIARPPVVQALEACGALTSKEAIVHSVPRGERSGSMIEPYLTTQWYVNVKPLAQSVQNAVNDGRVRFHSDSDALAFHRWMDQIQPWCISRQLWWGHQLPVWYGPRRTNDSGLDPSDPPYKVFVAENAVEACEQAALYYHCPVECRPDAVSIVDLAADPERFLTLNDHSVSIVQEADVLDTWFSSALWPFSTLGWPQHTHDLATYYPNALLITGKDILFFWVARMLMMGMHLTGEVPFAEVYLHALVRDSKGAKMSKSKGNTIDPLVMIERYGADALRFALTLLNTTEKNIPFSEDKVRSCRNFMTKVWNAYRFAQTHHCLDDDVDSATPLVLMPLNQWIISELNRVAEDISSLLLAKEYQDAALTLYRFMWNCVCDWYLESAKPYLRDTAIEAERREVRATVRHVLFASVKLLHPFAPLVSEALYQEMRGERDPSLMDRVAWPSSSFRCKPEVYQEITTFFNVISEIRALNKRLNVPRTAERTLVYVTDNSERAAVFKQWSARFSALAQIHQANCARDLPPDGIVFYVDEHVFALVLKGFVNVEHELHKAQKDLLRVKDEITKVAKRLNSSEFLTHAPEHIVQEVTHQHDLLLDQETQVTQIIEHLQRIYDHNDT